MNINQDESMPFNLANLIYDTDNADFQTWMTTDKKNIK